jgi:hypothetical protein
MSRQGCGGMAEQSRPRGLRPAHGRATRKELDRQPDRGVPFLSVATEPITPQWRLQRPRRLLLHLHTRQERLP